MQAQENCRALKTLYERTYKNEYEGVFGSFVLFPNYVITESEVQLLDNNPRVIVLDSKNMSSLAEAIENIFKYYKGTRKTHFTKDQHSKLMELINDRKAIAAAAGELIAYKEKEFDTINRVQDNYIYLLKEHKQILVSGGAGTGKTWIGMKMADIYSKNKEKTLFLCSSEKLSLYIKKVLEQEFNNKCIDVLCFRDLIKKDGKEISIMSNTSVLLDSYNDNEYEKYDSIIVDEAQDFDKYEAMIIRLHLKDDNNSKLCVFYDKTQNLLNKDFEDGFMISENAFCLRENLRNTASIYNFACLNTNLGKEVIANQIIGVKPEKSTFHNLRDWKDYVEDVLNRLIRNENISYDTITFIVSPLLRDKINNMEVGSWIIGEKDSNDSNHIFLSLIEDFKGMESNIVFYLHENDTSKELDYVAYTRAKYYLYDFILKEN